MSVSSFNNQLGGLKQGFSTDYASKAKSDTMALLEAQAPSKRNEGVKSETTLGTLAGASKLGEDLVGVKEKIDKGKSAIQKAQSTISNVNDTIQGKGGGADDLMKGIQHLKPTAPATTDQGKAPTIDKPLTNTSAGAKDVSSTQAPSQEMGRLPAVDDLVARSSGRSGVRIGDGTGAPSNRPLTSAEGFGRSRPTNLGGDSLSPMRDAMGANGDRALAGASRKVPMNVNGSLSGGGNDANSALSKMSSLVNDSKISGGGGQSFLRGANAPTSSNAHSFVSNLVGGAGGEEDAGAGIGSKIAGGINKVRETSEAVAGGLSKGLEAGASALDALGPIGDILGVGLAIVGGVEAHRQKMEAEHSTQTAEASVANTTAPTTKGLVGTTNVALDTSKQQAPMAQAHY